MSVAAVLLLAGGTAGAAVAQAATRPMPVPVIAGVAGSAAHVTQTPVSASTASTASSAKCVFLTVIACTSLDPSVAVEGRSAADSSGCVFSGTTDWGDGSVPTSFSSAGGTEGTIFDLGAHTYTATGTMMITVTGTVTSGSCTFTSGVLRFTLASLITSPVANALIAMTDPAYLSPQATAAGRAPATRDLTVTGVDNCGCAITVNGLPADVTGATWYARVPVTGPGPLAISVATAAGEHDSAGITLIDLRVVSPAENATLPITTAPAMPGLDASLEIAGLPAGRITSGIVFTWTLQMINRYVVPQNRWLDDVRQVATGTTTGTTAAWKLPAGTPVVGGWGRLTVTASIFGLADAAVVSEPRWINIPGTNPGKPAVTAYLASQDGEHAAALTQLACVASGGTFGQFRQTPQPLAISHDKQVIAVPAASGKIPAGWPNPAPLRPLFSYPSGIGIMGLTPATFTRQHWDWHANVLGGISLYAQKQAVATAWRAHEQKVIDAVRSAALKTVNAARKAKGLAAISVRRVMVPAYSASQLTQDTIRGYNGYGAGARYHQFTFQPHYAMSADHLHLTVAPTPAWVRTPIPATGNNNPGYVASVLACR